MLSKNVIVLSISVSNCGFFVAKIKYSFNANTLNMQAESAIAAAFGGIA